MADKLSRRKIASYIADKIISGGNVKNAMREVAAYLLDTNRTREAELIVRAIEDTLAERGTIIATVTTARTLSAELRTSIKKLVSAKHLHIREVVDPTVIGGVRIQTPGSKLDATIQRKILALRQAKV